MLILIGTFLTGTSFIDTVAVPVNTRALLFPTLPFNLKSSMASVCINFPLVFIISNPALNNAALGRFVCFIFNGLGITKFHCPVSIHAGLPLSLFCILDIEPIDLVKFEKYNIWNG